MIHGYITPEGKLVLSSPSPTDQFALKCWFAKFAERPSSVTLVIQDKDLENDQ
jgi:hypothetical protein